MTSYGRTAIGGTQAIPNVLGSVLLRAEADREGFLNLYDVTQPGEQTPIFTPVVHQTDKLTDLYKVWDIVAINIQINYDPTQNQQMQLDDIITFYLRRLKMELSIAYLPDYNVDFALWGMVDFFRAYSMVRNNITLVFGLKDETIRRGGRAFKILTREMLGERSNISLAEKTMNMLEATNLLTMGDAEYRYVNGGTIQIPPGGEVGSLFSRYIAPIFEEELTWYNIGYELFYSMYIPLPEMKTALDAISTNGYQLDTATFFNNEIEKVKSFYDGRYLTLNRSSYINNLYVYTIKLRDRAIMGATAATVIVIDTAKFVERQKTIAAALRTHVLAADQTSLIMNELKAGSMIDGSSKIVSSTAIPDLMETQFVCNYSEPSLVDMVGLFVYQTLRTATSESPDSLRRIEKMIVAFALRYQTNVGAALPAGLQNFQNWTLWSSEPDNKMQLLFAWINNLNPNIRAFLTAYLRNAAVIGPLPQPNIHNLMTSHCVPYSDGQLRGVVHRDTRWRLPANANFTTIDPIIPVPEAQLDNMDLTYFRNVITAFFNMVINVGEFRVLITTSAAAGFRYVVDAYAEGITQIMRNISQNSKISSTLPYTTDQITKDIPNFQRAPVMVATIEPGQMLSMLVYCIPAESIYTFPKSIYLEDLALHRFLIAFGYAYGRIENFLTVNMRAGYSTMEKVAMAEKFAEQMAEVDTTAIKAYWADPAERNLLLRNLMNQPIPNDMATVINSAQQLSTTLSDLRYAGGFRDSFYIVNASSLMNAGINQNNQHIFALNMADAQYNVNIVAQVNLWQMIQEKRTAFIRNSGSIRVTTSQWEERLQNLRRFIRPSVQQQHAGRLEGILNVIEVLHPCMTKITYKEIKGKLTGLNTTKWAPEEKKLEDIFNKNLPFELTSEIQFFSATDYTTMRGEIDRVYSEDDLFMMAPVGNALEHFYDSGNVIGAANMRQIQVRKNKYVVQNDVTDNVTDIISVRAGVLPTAHF